MVTLRNVVYSFPTVFVIFSAKSQENSGSRGNMEASIPKLLFWIKGIYQIPCGL